MSPAPLPTRCPPPLEKESPAELYNMLAATPYKAFDPYLSRLRDRGSAVIAKLSAISDTEERMKGFSEFIEMRPGDRKVCVVMPGFVCEYGFNVSLGDDVFIGPNCTFLDVAKIYIGDRTMIGANTQVYTPCHPISPDARNGLRGPEWAQPITIGDDCWIGGGVVICPGVTIGNGVTIGAGSVVTKSIPDRTVAVGNPARVIKTIDAEGNAVKV